jgi:ligand-binding sensor domain-containing protein
MKGKKSKLTVKKHLVFSRKRYLRVIMAAEAAIAYITDNSRPYGMRSGTARRTTRAYGARMKELFKKTAYRIYAAFGVALLCALPGGADTTLTVYGSSDETPAAMAFDKNVLWIGYADGLLRYSIADSTSRRFTVREGLASDTVNAIAVDGSGRKWIGTAKGISVFDDIAWSQHRIADSVGNNAVNALLLGKNNAVWAATGRGLYAFNGAAWTPAPIPRRPVTSLCLDSTGTLWAGTIGQGVWRYDGQAWKQDTAVWGLDTDWAQNGDFRLVPGVVDTSLSSDTVYGVLADNAGAVWCATAFGISSYKNGHWRRIKTRVGPAFYGIAVDKAGAKWFGSTWYLLRLRDTTLTSFDRTSGIYQRQGWDYPLRAVVCGPDGAVWAGTGSVISRCDGNAWSYHTVSDGLHSSTVCAIVVDRDKSLWFTANNGIVRFDGKKWRRYSNYDGLFINDCIYDMAVDSKGNKWIGAGTGLCKFDGSRFTLYDTIDNQPVNGVYRLAIDSMDRVWFGNDTLAMFDGTHLHLYPNPYWTTQSGPLMDIAVSPQDRVWTGYLDFGTTGNGVFTVDNGQWNRLVIPGEKINNSVYGLSFEPSGALWIAHNSGVSSFDNSSWVHYTCFPQYFPAADPVYKIGVGCNYIGYTCVLKDDGGRLWFGSNGTGATMYDGKDWHLFDSTRGLPNNMVESLAKDADGNVWIGTIRGVARANVGVLTDAKGPSRASPPSPPIVVIRQAASRRVFISLGGGEQECRFDLYSLSGRLLFSQLAAPARGGFLSPRFPTGAYVARVIVRGRSLSQRILLFD